MIRGLAALALAAALAGAAARGVRDAGATAQGATERVPLARPLDVLVGPLSPLGDPRSPYDDVLLAQGRKYAESFPTTPKDLVSANYYDLALVLYTVHYRTGDAYWLEQARRVARIWRDGPNNTQIEPFLAGNWVLGPHVPPARGMATLGLAVLAVEARDKTADRVVDAQARLAKQLMAAGGEYGLHARLMPLGDAREAGYALMALVAATALGHDHRPEARQLVDAILDRQLSTGQWRSGAEDMPGQPFTLNYMNGLLMEALVLYDRAIGDERIVPALRRAVAWTWRTQWRADARAFQYGDIDAGTIETKPAALLNGLLLPAWGYLWAVSGDPVYREQGDQILAGLVDSGLREIYAVKMFDEAYRSSARYLGFTLPPRPGDVGALKR